RCHIGRYSLRHHAKHQVRQVRHKGRRQAGRQGHSRLHQAVHLRTSRPDGPERAAKRCWPA
ncbi:MAG: hypothetical protein ACK53Y_03115, partial [bacterium]